MNDKKILESDNMFLPHRIDVTDKLKSAGETNTLTIVFGMLGQPRCTDSYSHSLPAAASAFIKGRIIEEEHLGKDKHLPLWNGDPARLWVRKEGAQWGWDWGPTLMSGEPFRLPSIKQLADLCPRSGAVEARAPRDLRGSHCRLVRSSGSRLILGD